MGPFAGSRAVVAIFGAALVFAGSGFGGYGLMLALLPRLGAIGAAEVTAAIFLIAPLGYLAVASFRSPPPVGSARPVPRSDIAVLSVLATVARDRPLLAVLGACLFGGGRSVAETTQMKVIAAMPRQPDGGVSVLYSARQGP